MATMPSLDELLREVPPKKLDQPCTDEHLCEIALSVTEWKSVVPFLGLTEAEQEEIERDYRGTRTHGIEELRRWRKKFGRHATYRRLAEIFYRMEQAGLVEELCGLLSTSGNTALASYLKQRNPILDSYANYLRGVYRTDNPDFLILQWPPSSTGKVFNLAMILHESIQHGPIDEGLVRLTLWGDVNDIMCRKTAVKVENIFKLDTLKHKRRALVLIEGAPGAGKSTLAWHIPQKWAQGELFQEFEVVVFIQLRDPEVQAAQSLADLLPARNRATAEMIASELCASDGQNVLFVLDSWDEFSTQLEQGSIFQQLICNPKMLSLHLSTVLITSRPIASGVLHRYVSSRVEIVGFTPTERKQYFTEVLRGDSEKVQKLENHLSQHPVIEASCYLPLNAAIVAHLFLTLNQTLPTTLHGVFTSLVICCLIRHMQRERREELISSFEDLPEDIQQLFKNICILAYHGIMKNKVTFSTSDLQSFNLPTELSTLSLIQGVESFKSFKKVKSYNFLHLSIQELLAAFYIAKLPESEQIRIFKELFGEPRFATVFQYYAAFSKLQAEGVREVIVNIVKIEKQKGHGEMKPLLLSLLHCLYEAQDLSLCHLMASQLNGEMNLEGNSLSPVDCLVVGYFLRSVCLTTSGEFKANLTSCSLDDYRVSFLVRNVSKYSSFSSTMAATDGRPGCLDLDLSSNINIHGRGLKFIAELLNRSSLIRKLTLKRCHKLQVGENGLHWLLQALITNSSLTHLSLESCSLNFTKEDDGPILAQMLSQNKTLKSLNLSRNDVSDETAFYLADGLKHNTGLELLLVKKCCITEKGAQLLSESLNVNTSLATFNIGDNDLGDYGTAHISHSLTLNNTLKELFLTKCKLTQKRVDSLVSNRSLVTLDMSRNSLGDEGISCISHSLKVNTTLTELYLDQCKLTEKGVDQLSQVLTLNKSLEALSVSTNSISDAGATQVSQDVLLTDPSIMFGRISWIFAEKLGPETNHSKKFHKQAVFTEEVLNSYPATVDEKPFTNETFIKILQHLLLAAEIGTPKHIFGYFMPSLLESSNIKDISKISADLRKQPSSLEPLLVCFQDNWAPLGVFCALVVFLLSHTSPRWHIDELLSNEADSKSLESNHLQFTCTSEERSVTVTLLNTFKHFEVHVHGSSRFGYQILRQIRDYIDQGIWEACKKLSLSCELNVTHYFGLFCPCDPQNPHPATVDWNSLLWKCPQTSGNDQKCDMLSWKQRAWFTHTMHDPADIPEDIYHISAALQATADSPAPLLVYFPNKSAGFVSDTFSSLIFFLLDNPMWKLNEMSSDPMLKSKETSSCELKMLYKNYVQFSIEDYEVTVTLLNTVEHYEIHVQRYPDYQFPHEVLPIIKDSLAQGLRSAVKKSSHEITYRFGFSCPCGNKEPHPASMEGSEPGIVCSAEGRTMQLSWKQRMWITGKAEMPGYMRSDSDHPGISYFGDPLSRRVDSKGATLNWQSWGVALNIPPGAVPEGQEVDIKVHPCMSGPFVLPDNYRLASPVYQISHSANFVTNVELSLEHTLYLQTEEDCQRMVIVSSTSADLLNKDLRAQYKFNKIKHATAEFKPKTSYGLVKLSHFCKLAVATVDSHSATTPVALTHSNLTEICDVLKDAGFLPSGWEGLAAQLGISDPDGITKKTPDLCLRETIRQWLHNDTAPTWEKLATAVSKVHEYGQGTKKRIMDLTMGGISSDPGPLTEYVAYLYRGIRNRGKYKYYYYIFSISLKLVFYKKILEEFLQTQYDGIHDGKRSTLVQFSSDKAVITFPHENFEKCGYMAELDLPPVIAKYEVDRVQRPGFVKSNEYCGYPPIRTLICSSMGRNVREVFKCYLSVEGVNMPAKVPLNMRLVPPAECPDLPGACESHDDDSHDDDRTKSSLDMRPNMMKLFSFEGKQGDPINILEQIGESYAEFGVFLLNDENGNTVDAIESQYINNALQINRTILTKWMNGEGRQPCTWRTLLLCLRKARKIELAKRIEEGL